MNKIAKTIVPLGLALALSGCADFVQSLEPLAQEADKAWEVIQGDLDNTSEKVNSGQDVSWKDFSFITDNESLNSFCQDLENTKEKVSVLVEEASKPIPYTESSTYKSDLSSLASDGTFVTCMYLNDEASADTEDISGSEEVKKEADICFFLFQNGKVSYVYSKNFPKDKSDFKPSQDIAASVYAVNLVRANETWIIESMGENASDIDSDKIIASLNNYEKVLSIPSEDTFKSGGLYNALNLITSQQDLSSDIFLNPGTENEYIVFSYNKEKLVTITDISGEFLYMIGQEEDTSSDSNNTQSEEESQQ